MNQDVSIAAGEAASGDASGATLWTVERDITTTSHRPLDGRPVPLSAPVRWVLGAIVAIGGLVALTGYAKGRVESTLTDRTFAAMVDAGLDPDAFDIDFDFRDGTVAGVLPEGWSEARWSSEITVSGANQIDLLPPTSPQETDS